MNESLLKYVIPTFKIFKDKITLNILDICFGLGYNTFTTILYMLQNNIKTKINIYSPELDAKLIESLKDFKYPKEFNKIKHIINELSSNNFYQDEQFFIKVFIGDARDYIKKLPSHTIDVVYQDPFSSDVNKELWTQEYFSDITSSLNNKAIVLTYSIATPIRLGMSNNDLKIYEFKYNDKRKATLASNFTLTNNLLQIKPIDMKKKLINNPIAKPLLD